MEFEARVLDGNLPILWIKGSPDDDEEQSLEISSAIQGALKQAGYSFTMVHTPHGYDLNALDAEGFAKLLDANTLNRLGYVREEVLLALLTAVGKPINLTEEHEEYVAANKDKIKARWYEKGGKRFIGIEFAGGEESEKQEATIIIPPAASKKRKSRKSGAKKENKNETNSTTKKTDSSGDSGSNK